MDTHERNSSIGEHSTAMSYCKRSKLRRKESIKDQSDQRPNDSDGSSENTCESIKASSQISFAIGHRSKSFIAHNEQHQAEGLDFPRPPSRLAPARAMSLAAENEETKPLEPNHQQPTGNVEIQPTYSGKTSCAIRKERIKTKSYSWWLTATLVALISLTLTDWRPDAGQQIITGPQLGEENSSPALYETVMNLIGSKLVLQARVLVAEAQYRPDWPSKALQQEIFLLNLEDGYFGCQVNESQDFLQLFELSHLCDGSAQCYLGTDEMSSPLKCNQRERCGTYVNPRGQQETIRCVNGVCLDGLCYCNDGFGGKACDIPDENECKYRPCDVFAHCTNTMGSYYCSCFPGKLNGSNQENPILSVS